MTNGDKVARMEHLSRFIRTVPGAAEVMKFFKSKKAIDKLLSAATRGIPPVTAVSADLIALLGPDRANNRELAKFVGRATRVIMEANGFELSRRNVRVRSDPMFTVGSAYRKATDVGKVPQTADRKDLLYRILDTLSPDELNAVRDYVLRRSPS